MPGDITLIALQPLGKIDFPVSTSVVQLASLGIPATASYAIIEIQDNPIRWLCGTNPTANFGIIQAAGSRIEFMDNQFDFRDVLLSMRFIRAGASDANLTVSFFG